MHLNLEFSDEQKILANSAREFAKRHVPKALVKELEKEPTGFSHELWKQMAQLGWLGWTVPTDYAGVGGSFVDIIVLIEEVGRACIPGPFISTAVIATSVLLEAGSEEQKLEFLPKICKGEAIIIEALAETDVAGSLRIEAETSGEKYKLNGIAPYVSYAQVASHLLCTAKTTQGNNIFLVEASNPGISLQALPSIDVYKHSQVTFDGVETGKNDILGDTVQGREYLEHALQKATIAKCAEILGGAQQVFEMSVEYAKERVQFGKPIGAQQAVQHHCANMLIDVEGMRRITYKAAWMLDRDLSCKKEVAAAKAWANEAGQRMRALGHQIHAGIGYQYDHDMHLYTKQFRIGKAAFGDTREMRDMMAKELGL